MSTSTQTTVIVLARHFWLQIFAEQILLKQNLHFHFSNFRIEIEDGILQSVSIQVQLYYKCNSLESNQFENHG